MDRNKKVVASKSAWVGKDQVMASFVGDLLDNEETFHKILNQDIMMELSEEDEKHYVSETQCCICKEGKSANKVTFQLVYETGSICLPICLLAFDSDYDRYPQLYGYANKPRSKEVAIGHGQVIVRHHDHWT